MLNNGFSVFTITLVLFSTVVAASDAVVKPRCGEVKKSTTSLQGFVDNGDGTLTHKRSKLTWMRCALGMDWSGKSCDGQSLAYSRVEADEALDELNGQRFLGRSTWRLPTLKELSSTVETHCHSPSINLQLFPLSPRSGFWSSTPYEGLQRRGWIVHFLYGGEYVSNRRQGWRVRPVSSQ